MEFKKMLIAVILISVLVSMPFVLIKATHAENQPSGQDAVLDKLSQVLDNQRSIIQTLASIKEELNVVKIRVTQQQ
jgi:hypothetical protein